MTQRAQAEKRANPRADTLQTYLDIAGVIFVILDREGNVTLINKKGCEILRRSEDEILGKNWFRDFLPERLRAGVTSVFRKLMAGEVGPVEYFENPILTGDGEERVIAWHNAVVRDNDGEPVGSLSSGEDVTDRIRAEEKRSRSDAVIRVQRDLAVDLNSVIDLDAGLRLCIRAALAVSGMDDGGVYIVNRGSSTIELATYIGSASPRFIDRVSSYEWTSARGRIVLEGIPRYAEFTSLGEPLDEVERAERIRAVAVIPIHHENEVIACLNVISRRSNEVPGFARDALESIAAQVGGAIARLRALDDLRESERRYRTLFDSANDGILLMERDRLVDCNAKTLDMLGCERRGVIGRALSDFSPEVQPYGTESKPEILRKIEQTLDGSPQRFEWRCLRPDMGCFDAEVSLTHSDFGGKRYILAIVRDVTERKRAEAKLQESYRKLRESLSSTLHEALR
jgi:PAS domain S-box-containing protein